MCAKSLHVGIAENQGGEPQYVSRITFFLFLVLYELRFTLIYGLNKYI